MKTFLCFCILMFGAAGFATAAEDKATDKAPAASKAPASDEGGWEHAAVTGKVPLGGEGGWDYLTVDGPAHRLYNSRGNHVMVVDLATKKIAGDIPDMAGVHGIALAPELHRGFTSNGRANTATIFDPETLKVLGTVATGKNPDAILYDPASKRVFTLNGASQDATAFDAVTSAVLATIPLGGKPEFAASDGKGKVFVNIEDKNEVAEIDSMKLVVTRRFPLAPGEEPTGLAIDLEHHRLFAGCHNKLLVILDTETGKVVATAPIGGGVDATAFDPQTQLAFASNGEGTLTVVKETAPDKFDVVANVPTHAGSRTMALDATTHQVYLPFVEYAPAAVPAAAGARPQRPAMVPDSFGLLVVGAPEAAGK
jgi:DNA-binding beta-propeller fold protein YncE